MIVRTRPTYGQKPDKIASNDVNIYSDIQELVETADDFTDDRYLSTGAPIIYAFLPNASVQRKDTVTVAPQWVSSNGFQGRIPLQQYRNEFQGRGTLHEHFIVQDELNKTRQSEASQP